MNGQSKLAKSLRDDFHDTSGIALIAKPHHEVIRIADEEGRLTHSRLHVPLDKPGAMTLYHAPPAEHLSLARHLSAERKTGAFVAGKGVVVKWERMRKQNHWFDALYNACAAGHLVGVRLVDDRSKKERPPKTLRQLHDEAEARRKAQDEDILDVRWSDRGYGG